uniref:Uncharacterized protein n=1 Tax=Arundo donax TaxID=35708 RepID=A0A0A9DIC9_ARUDO
MIVCKISILLNVNKMLKEMLINVNLINQKTPD